MTPSSRVAAEAASPTDFVKSAILLSEEEKQSQQAMRAFVDEHVIPGVAEHWDKNEFPFDILPGLGATGVMDGTFSKDYGCSGWNDLGYGLAIAEVARGSGSLATVLHVQSGLAMATIHELSSEEQKNRWLPEMARCTKIGCFGLTEPDAGSDPGAVTTTAGKVEGGYRLNGQKRWIGNASFADVAVIWAKTDKGRVAGFLVDGAAKAEGFEADSIERKASQRAVWQTHIRMAEVFVPDEDRLPKANGLGSTLSVLTHSRYGVGWDGLGQATDCYETALSYAAGREQFGNPIASYQLAQQKLVSMINAISQMQLLAVHVGRLKEAGELDSALVSMFKMNNVGTAREIAASTRDVVGGNGVLLDYRVMEHMDDIEGTYSYEGTNDVNTLIVGQAITGHRTFAPRPATSSANGRAEKDD